MNMTCLRRLFSRSIHAHPTITKSHNAFRFASTWYTPQHEYVRVDGSQATIGITDFAQNQLGDVVYVELPTVGTALEKG